MKEVEVKFGRKVKTGDYETATFEITAKAAVDGADVFVKTPELFQILKDEVEKEIVKFKEEQKQRNGFTGQNKDQKQNVLGTTKETPTTKSAAGDVDLPPRFSIVDPRNPDKTLYNVESGMAIDTLGAYKGTLEPRAGKTGPYYLLKGIGILTRNKNNWYLKDKRNGQWVTIGVLKI